MTGNVEGPAGNPIGGPIRFRATFQRMADSIRSDVARKQALGLETANPQDPPSGLGVPEKQPTA